MIHSTQNHYCFLKLGLSQLCQGKDPDPLLTCFNSLWNTEIAKLYYIMELVCILITQYR